MKKQILLCSALFSVFISFAQTTPWNVNGTHIYNPNAGSVGIGTVSPVEKVHVIGTLKVDYPGTGNGGVRIFRDGSTGITSHLYLGNSGNNRAFNFQLNADGSAMTLWSYNGSAWANKFTFTNDGKLGMGTTSPAARLHMSTSSSESGLIIDHAYTSAYSFGALINVNHDQTKALVVQRMNGGSGTTVFQVWGNGTVNMKNVYAEAITVTTTAIGAWPDYVFKKDYKLMPLKELETYISKNNHLPNVPSESDVQKNGVNLYDMNKALLEKVEELSLYVIELQKQVDCLKSKN